MAMIKIISIGLLIFAFLLCAVGFIFSGSFRNQRLKKVKTEVIISICEALCIVATFLCFISSIVLMNVANDAAKMPKRAEQIEYMLEHRDELTISERYALKEEISDYNEEAEDYNKNPRFYGFDAPINTFSYELSE